MCRLVTVLATTAAAPPIASPASAFARDRVHNPALHPVLDGRTLPALTAPLWTVMPTGGSMYYARRAAPAAAQVRSAVGR